MPINRTYCSIVLSATLAGAAFGQQPAPSLAVDAGADRHPISPYVYGINGYADAGLGTAMHIPVRRIGGDATTAYNWKLDVDNAASDYYFENFLDTPSGAPPLPDGSSVNLAHEADLASGTLTLGTISLMDWTPKDSVNCSYSVEKYGAQKEVNPYNKDCGNGILASNGQQITADPNDAYTPLDDAFEQSWVNYLVNRYGPANQGGIRLWSMDNEPEWWSSVHVDIYQQPATYDDMLARNIARATVVKGADPSAMVTGPVPGGWSGMFFSRADMQNGWNKSPYYYWDNPTDQNAHGGVPWVAYYLQQMKQFEQQHGTRLLDVLDVHAYITPDNLSATAGNAAMETLRMTSTRALWDPNYMVPMSSAGNRLFDNTGKEAAPQLVPRMLAWVSQNYPGTKTAITEYNWGALTSITGAIAQADILGIFGRESLDYGTLWGPPALTDPGSFAFRVFLNYDGAGNQFGSTGVSATSSDPDTLSLFAAERADSALTILVLNKSSNTIEQSVPIANFVAAGTAQVWQYGASNLNAITRQGRDATVANGTVTATFPAQSMTLLVIPQAQSAMSVPQPVISSVGSAASYDTSAIAPGEIVTIFGKSLGPATLSGLQVTADNALSTSTGGVEVFINGYAAPMIYSYSTQLGAVVPYEIAGQQTVNVVVVNQGNPSAPVSVPVANVKPGIFSNDSTGSGQGAILNQDYSRNGPANPAPRGGIVMIYATGEGVTTPPGLDGRITGSVLPTVASCSATIGGITADVQYCGETPTVVNGLVQLNVAIPEEVTPGASVPVTITIGGMASQNGITMAVK